MSYLTLASAEASRVVQAEGVVEWAERQLTDFNDVIISAVMLIALIVVLIGTIKSKFALGGIIMSGITAALLIWIIQNMGKEGKPADLIDEQVDSPGNSRGNDQVNSQIGSIPSIHVLDGQSRSRG